MSMSMSGSGGGDTLYFSVSVTYYPVLLLVSVSNTADRNSTVNESRKLKFWMHIEEHIEMDLCFDSVIWLGSHLIILVLVW